MIMKNFKIILFVGGISGLIIGCAEKKKIGLANPASQNCIDKGGKLQIAKRGDGGQYGICVFSDDYQCEEWALFRGKCPLGGMKITGVLTSGGTYCVLQGGVLFENETICQLPSGKSCVSQDLYNGQCL